MGSWTTISMISYRLKWGSDRKVGNQSFRSDSNYFPSMRSNRITQQEEIYSLSWQETFNSFNFSLLIKEQSSWSGSAKNAKLIFEDKIRYFIPPPCVANASNSGHNTPGEMLPSSEVCGLGDLLRNLSIAFWMLICASSLLCWGASKRLSWGLSVELSGECWSAGTPDFAWLVILFLSDHGLAWYLYLIIHCWASAKVLTSTIRIMTRPSRLASNNYSAQK